VSRTLAFRLRPAAVLTRNRKFFALWAGESLAETGSQMTIIAMPLLVLTLTGSAAKAGLIGVVRAVAMAAAVIPAGVVSDRIDRRRLMILCACVRLVTIGSIPVALALGRPPFGLLLLAAMADASTYSVSYVAERSLLPVLVETSELPEAITANEARTASAAIAGPPAGGALFGLARAAPFIADAGSAVGELLALATIKLPRRENRAAQPARGGLLREIGEGFSWLFSHAFLRAGSLLYAAENVTIYAVQLLALLILHRHGVSPAGIGVSYAIIGAGGLLSAVIATPLRVRLSSRTAILIEPWSYVALLPLLLVVHSELAVGAVVAGMFLPMTLSTSIIVGARLQVTPDHLRGRVQASGAFMAVSLAWLGPLAVGLLVQYVGESAATITLASWAAITALAATGASGFRAAPPTS
jgi:MFS family permease